VSGDGDAAGGLAPRALAPARTEDAPVTALALSATSSRAHIDSLERAVS
jgi:hypothetical protein